jgi:hypothetical protein
MGARGGFKRVVGWKCTTCESLYDTRVGAIECCNDAVHEARVAKRAMRTKRAMARAGRVRVTFEKCRYSGEKNVIAKVTCPFKECWKRGPLKVTMRLVTDNSTRQENIKRAKALVRAQLARHVGSHGKYY